MNKWAWVVIPIIVILAAVTVTNGVFYFQESSKLKDAQSQITALEGNVSTLEGGVSGLQGDVFSLEGGVSALEGNVSTLEDNISTLGGDVFTLQGGVSGLQGDVSSLGGDVSALGDDVSTLGGDVSALGDDVLALEAHDQAVMNVVAMVEPSVVRIETDIAGGSGVIITNTGWVLTNLHVVDGASWIEITLMSGETYDGVIPYLAHNFLDIAIVKIDSGSTDFPAAVLGSSAEVTVGEQVVAIGYPLGLSGQVTFTTGIVSAVQTLDGDEWIQFDAAVHSGNSGGPLVNLKGEVIGINTGFLLDLRDIGGQTMCLGTVNLAVPIDDPQPFPEEVTG